MKKQVPDESKIAVTRLARLDRIKSLIKARPNITSKRLAEILEVSPRQIQRDIIALMTYGVPIFSRRGRNGGYSLPAGYSVSPDMFTVDEASSLSVGGEAIFGYTDLIVHEAVQTALAKMLAALPDRLRRQAQAVVDRIYFDHSKWYLKYHTSPLLEDLNRAVMNDRVIVVTFTERDDPSERTGHVDAYGLVCKADTWYLIGYFHEMATMRRFNLFRIVRVADTGSSFRRGDAFSLRDFWQSDLEQFGKGRTRVTIAVGAAAWTRLKDLSWKKECIFSETPTGMQVTMFVDGVDWVVDLVLVNRGEVVVLEPKGLQRRIARIGVALAHRHASGQASLTTETVDSGAIGLEILENMSVTSNS